MAEGIAQNTGQLSNVAVVYNIYRIVLPLVLLVTFISSPENTLLGEFDPTLFVQVTTTYAIFGVLVTFFAPTGGGILRNTQVLSGTIVVDILAITLIVFSSGGMISGMGLLLIVTMASGSILIRGRVSTFLAAIAALALIYSELYLSLVLEDSPNQFIQTGILGAILFITSLYIQFLSQRIHKATELASKQASDIVDLEKLNDEIIQRMRTGVVVVDPNNQIMTMNSSARTILGPVLDPAALSGEGTSRIPNVMLDQLELWKNNPKRQPQPIVIPNSNRQVQMNFAFLHPESDSDVLVFLEDNRQIIQRVRQMKLASLGRLTASIAHEVRNPLGAISHASQLLRESDRIEDADKRMIEIILAHCKRVNMIIEDVLDASRHDDTSSKKINLKEWLERFIENYKSTHKECDEIELRTNSEDAEVNVIEGQLEQVLNNLFENGIRYSLKATGRATLKVVCGMEVKDGDVQPYVHIIDKGPGIDDEAEALLFEPFHTTEATGTGLGLYISKELCEANQSQLTYRRTDDGNSCFSIYFSHPARSVA
ncbi:MAG: ATP-binding protein [Gammaproteobacteria bacterium]